GLLGSKRIKVLSTLSPTAPITNTRFNSLLAPVAVIMKKTITMGRFKVMAYTYEYQPLASVLVYPGLDKRGVDYDDEDSATRELDRRAKERGLIDFWYNSNLIYIAIIDPLKDDDEYNLRIIGEILKKLV
ncbi:hypothetical protein WIW52_03060, partial [Stygiolobus sp. RP850M]